MPNPAIEFTVRSYFQRIDSGQLPLLSQLAAPDYRPHFTGITDPLNTAFPHHRVVVEHAIGDGEYVAELHTHHATHTGPFLGMPATGKAIVVNGLELFRFADGRIVEFWRKDDDASLLMQLGMLSAPQGAYRLKGLPWPMTP